MLTLAAVSSLLRAAAAGTGGHEATAFSRDGRNAARASVQRTQNGKDGEERQSKARRPGLARAALVGMDAAV